MTQRPTVTARKLIAALKKLGFDVVRIKGSHHFLRHADGRTTVVPVHTGEDVGPGLLSKILRATKLTREDLERHL